MLIGKRVEGVKEFARGTKNIVVYLVADVTGYPYASTVGRWYAYSYTWENDRSARAFILPAVIPLDGNYTGPNWGSTQQEFYIPNGKLDDPNFHPFMNVPTRLEYAGYFHDYQNETLRANERKVPLPPRNETHLGWVVNAWTGLGVEPGPVGQAVRLIGTPAFLLFYYVDKE